MLRRGKGNNKITMIKPEDDKAGRTGAAGGNRETAQEAVTLNGPVLLFFLQLFF